MVPDSDCVTLPAAYGAIYDDRRPIRNAKLCGVDTDANGVGRRALRGPTWFATLTGGSEQGKPVERPNRLGTVPCALRGTTPGLPRRWTNGHLEIDEDELRWWPHFGGRSTALVLSLRFLQCWTERPMQKREGWSINPYRVVSSRCTVFVCECPGGSAEFALIFEAQVDRFRRDSASLRVHPCRMDGGCHADLRPPRAGLAAMVQRLSAPKRLSGCTPSGGRGI